MTTSTITTTTLRPYLKTTYDVTELLDSLQTVQNTIFTGHTTFSESLKTQIPIPISTSITKLATEQQIRLDDPVADKQFLIRLQDAIKNIPVLHLTISFSPTLQLINQISDWLILNMPHHVILDFTIDRTLIGGAKVGFQGKYIDHSLKKQIAGLFIKKATNN